MNIPGTEDDPGRRTKAKSHNIFSTRLRKSHRSPDVRPDAGSRSGTVASALYSSRERQTQSRSSSENVASMIAMLKHPSSDQMQDAIGPIKPFVLKEREGERILTRPISIRIVMYLFHLIGNLGAVGSC